MVHISSANDCSAVVCVRGKSTSPIRICPRFPWIVGGLARENNLGAFALEEFGRLLEIMRESVDRDVLAIVD